MSKAKPTPDSPDEDKDKTVALNVRISQSIHNALRRAAVERRIQGESPDTQQGIAEVALSAWLRSHGFLEEE